jgi:hypothetical protein
LLNMYLASHNSCSVVIAVISINSQILEENKF